MDYVAFEGNPPFIQRRYPIRCMDIGGLDVRYFDT